MQKQKLITYLFVENIPNTGERSRLFHNRQNISSTRDVTTTALIALLSGLFGIVDITQQVHIC
jgi:hypothetical protein